MPFLEHEGIRFHYDISGEGPPVVFCHGLTGNLEQPKELIPSLPGFQFIVWDARGHGKTNPPGPRDGFTFDTFARDLAALLAHLDVREAVIGGISMGAAVSVRYAIRYPGRARALVLVRPAWLESGLPEGLRLHPRVAEYLEAYGVERGRQLFAELPEFKAMEEQHPDVTAGIIGQFSQEDAFARRDRLSGIPRDAPIRNWHEVEELRIPALVIGNDSDVVHPWSFAEAWASHLPSAQLVKVPPRPIDFPAHALAVRKHLEVFLEPFRERNK